ncbi:L,D-transpeptidase family protein [Promicromonospora thailandica]|nr:L,D-transpeptidase family protein [Promicromonospora thailandica]
MHARPARGAGRVVGTRVMGTLGAVALTAGLLSACGQEEPPTDAASSSSPAPTGSSSPAPSTPSAEPGTEEPGTDEPGTDQPGTDEPTPDESAGDGTDEGGDGTGQEPGDEASEDPGEDEKPEDGGTGQDEGDSTSDDNGDDKGDDEPEKPDHLQLGSSGERVGDLQQRLQDLGYFVTSVDGEFGSETQQAVFALQKAGGLYRDGVVGDVTLDAADRGVVPRAQTSSGKVLEIDIDRQLVLAVEDGRVVRVINASSGNGETYEAQGATYTAYTPRGSFAVYREVNRMHSSTLELGDMWRPKFFTGGIAVHGSASVPAFPASHGCVRVSNSAMNWIWDTWGAPSGTPVVVY